MINGALGEDGAYVELPSDSREGGVLPIRRNVFEDNVQDAAVYEGFCFINNEFMDLPALTPEQLDRAVGFIEGVHHFTFD